MNKQSYSYISHMHVWFPYAGTIPLLHFHLHVSFLYAGTILLLHFHLHVWFGYAATILLLHFLFACMDRYVECVRFYCTHPTHPTVLHPTWSENITFLQPYHSNLLHHCTIKVAHRNSHPKFLFFSLLQYNCYHPSYIPTPNKTLLQYVYNII